MAEENISQEFRFKKTDETRNFFIEKINKNELVSKKHKKICSTLNYIGHFLFLSSTITGSVSISAFASFVSIPIGIKSFAICAITAGIKKI